MITDGIKVCTNGDFAVKVVTPEGVVTEKTYSANHSLFQQAYEDIECTMIEAVKISPEVVMLVDEDGLMRKLDHNEIATQLALGKTYMSAAKGIVGTVVLAPAAAMV